MMMKTEIVMYRVKVFPETITVKEVVIEKTSQQYVYYIDEMGRRKRETISSLYLRWFEKKSEAYDWSLEVTSKKMSELAGEFRDLNKLCTYLQKEKEE